MFLTCIYIESNKWLKIYTVVRNSVVNCIAFFKNIICSIPEVREVEKTSNKKTRSFHVAFSLSVSRFFWLPPQTPIKKHKPFDLKESFTSLSLQTQTPYKKQRQQKSPTVLKRFNLTLHTGWCKSTDRWLKSQWYIPPTMASHNNVGTWTSILAHELKQGFQVAYVYPLLDNYLKTLEVPD